MKDILVVDDDMSIREVVAQLLTEEGYLVQQAGDGAVALRILATRTPDLIILDLSMPRMNGWEFLVHQRRVERIREIPILIFAAGRDVVQDPVLASARGVLPKPIDVEELLSTVEAQLQ